MSLRPYKGVFFCLEKGVTIMYYKVKDIATMCNKTPTTINNKLHDAVNRGILKSHVVDQTPIILNVQDLQIFLYKYYPYVYDTVKSKFDVGSQEGSYPQMTTLSNGYSYKPKGKTYFHIRDLVLFIDAEGNEVKYKNKIHFKTKTQADKHRQKLIKERNNGKYLKLGAETTRHGKGKPKETPLFLCDSMKEYILSKDIEEKTRKDYLSIYNTKIVPFFKNTLIKDLTKELVQDFADSLKANITKSRVLLNMYLDYLRKKGFVSFNASQDIDYPKDKGRGTQKKDALTMEELQLFYDYYKGHRLEHAIHLFFHTGMRPQEMQALTWNDIEYKEDNSIEVYITKAWGETEIGKGTKETKNQNSNRLIYVPPNEQLVKLLKQAKENSHGCKYVLYNAKYMAPIEECNFSKRYMSDVAKKLGIRKHITAHSIRHTYISLCLNQGIPLHTLQKQTGHTDATMILKTYGHNIQRMEKAFQNVSFGY